MYIEIHNWNDFEQKVLYFKLNNALNMQTETESNHKFIGVYAIYKDDICLYVGQSINLASRIATHLKGKYKESTEIFCWNIENIGFSDFKERSKVSKKEILDNCEKWLMTKLNPIENLSIIHDFIIEENKSPNICFESSSCFTINNRNEALYITDDFSYIYDNTLIEIDMLDYRKIIDKDTYLKVRESISKQDIVYLYSKGVSFE